MEDPAGGRRDARACRSIIPTLKGVLLGLLPSYWSSCRCQVRTPISERSLWLLTTTADTLAPFSSGGLAWAKSSVGYNAVKRPNISTSAKPTRIGALNWDTKSLRKKFI